MEKESTEIIQSDDGSNFWLSAVEESLKAIWDNDEDDVCVELLG